MKRTLVTITIVLAFFCTSAQVSIKGTVKNYSDSVFYILEQGGFHNITQGWRDKRVKVVIDSDHRFNAVIPEGGVNSWMIKFNNQYQFFDLVKGKDLELIADFSQPVPLVAIGKNADDFNYTTYANEHMDKDVKAKFLAGIKGKNIDSILACRKAYAAFQQKILNEYKASHKISDTYYQWLNAKYTYEPYERTLVENVPNRDSLDQETTAKLMANGINDDYAALNTVQYNDLVSFYMLKQFKEHSKEQASKRSLFRFALGNTLSGNTKEVYISRIMSYFVKDADSVYSPVFVQYDAVVKNEQLKQLITDARKDYAGVNTTVATSTVQGSYFSNLFKKYKGKVIYVDFWASWCAPCRSEMPNAAVLKEKLKSDNIVFIYFGYNDKEKAWQKAKEQLEIKGEHYLLDEKTVKEADELFGINGIPHYAIIDKDGKIVNKKADRPSDVYETLMKLLK
ncbi:MAG: TlpA disulfide reductase family protein [Chitinophagaceae bacterium]